MNIDPLARWYRWLEYAAFGTTLERARFAFLDRSTGSRNILILGEGDGRALARICKLSPAATIDVVDLSAEMIARARAGATENVHFRQGDARRMDWPSEAYDVVITFFFLDCFCEADARDLVAALTGSLKPGGVWLMSDFAIPARGWQRWHAVISLAAMYLFFRLTTGLRVRRLPPIARLLADAGLALVAQQRQRGGLVVSEVWRLTPGRKRRSAGVSSATSTEGVTQSSY